MMISFNAPNKLDVFFPILDIFLAIIFTGVVYLGDILHHDLPAAKHLSKKSRGRRVWKIYFKVMFKVTTVRQYVLEKGRKLNVQEVF